jgi:chemotaxis receptor (MCP) glutamine deamidase CheD
LLSADAVVGSCVTFCLQDEMACGGYRTLMIADKELSMDEYEDWQAAFAAASVRASI